MRFHDPLLPIVREEPQHLKELKRAIYEMERRRPETATLTIGDGTTNYALFDYLEVAGASLSTVGNNGQKLTVAERGSWTPIDGSGAGLSFTAAVGSYVRFPGAGLVVAQCAVVYPTTASAANATIGGLPYAVGATSYAVSACYTTDGTAMCALGVVSTTSVALVAAAGAAARTNANLSTDTVIFTLSYET